MTWDICVWLAIISLLAEAKIATIDKLAGINVFAVHCRSSKSLYIDSLHHPHAWCVNALCMLHCHAVLYVATTTTASRDTTENQQKAPDYFRKQPVQLKSTTAQCECICKSGGARSC